MPGRTAVLGAVRAAEAADTTTGAVHDLVRTMEVYRRTRLVGLDPADDA